MKDDNQKNLVEKLKREGILVTPEYINAFLKVDRKFFVWPGYEKYAYADNPLPLGDTGQTISAPHMYAYMTEALRPRPGEVILEIGSGSGYQAALLTEIVAGDDVDEKGFIYTVEIEPILVKFAEDNLVKAGYRRYVKVIYGDGSLGWPPRYDGMLYDGIIVTAAAPDILDIWLKQLKIGGRLILPVGRGFFQDLIRVVKVGVNKYRREYLLKCAFVPLRGRLGWRD